MLCAKANGDIASVIKLKELYSLDKIEKIFEFWTEITLPYEEREKRMREKADKAAQEAADTLFNAKMTEEHNEELDRFLEIYKRKT